MLDDHRLPQRFWDKVSPEPNTGCWLWTAYLNDGGYGMFKVEGKAQRAHRHAYEKLIGPIPDGLEPDHLCRTRSCVNPTHMEPVTGQVNTLRGLLPEMARARQLAKTHCPQGHLLSGPNLYRRPDGKRSCRTCRTEENRRYAANQATARSTYA